MASPIAHDGSNVHDAFGVPDTFEHSSAAAPFALAGALLTGAGLFSMALGLVRESEVPFSVELLCVFAALLLFLATRHGHVLIRLVALFTGMVALFPVGAGSERFLLPVPSEPALYLEEVGSWLVLVAGDPGWEMAVHPWDDAEPRSIPLDREALAGGWTTVSGALFVPVHETVFVHAGDEDRNRAVVGLR